MIIFYGYQDGSGDYFISFDTSECVACSDKPCIDSCPEKIIEIVIDDYGEQVVGIKEQERKKINYLCVPCKNVSEEKGLPCEKACSFEAVKHS